MCTIIPKHQIRRPKTATKDIVVYKGCDHMKGYNDESIVRSHYEFFAYIKDRLNTTTLTYYNGSHSASDSTERRYRDSLSYPVAVIHGYHSLLKPDEERLCSNATLLCEFIIPKGSKYHINPCGNIVSNQIIFKRIL